MTRINPLIQSPSGELHIGANSDMAICGKRSPGFIRKGSVNTAGSRSAMLAALTATGIDRLCVSCFTPTVRQAYAQARE